MTIQEQINAHINSLPETKRSEMETLHHRILKFFPGGKLWFLDGRDDKGKIVANPNIGYGLLKINYSGGKTKEFYQIGISANTTGISVYLMGIQDKKYLAETYGNSMGKAGITGYCIKFKTMKDINIAVLDAAIQDCIRQTS